MSDDEETGDDSNGGAAIAESATLAGDDLDAVEGKLYEIKRRLQERAKADGVPIGHPTVWPAYKLALSAIGKVAGIRRDRSAATGRAKALDKMLERGIGERMLTKMLDGEGAAERERFVEMGRQHKARLAALELA